MGQKSTWYLSLKSFPYESKTTADVTHLDSPFKSVEKADRPIPCYRRRHADFAFENTSPVSLKVKIKV